jgi:hypothetical protein
MVRFRAAIREEFERNGCRLMLTRDWGEGQVDYLLEDGTMQRVEPATFVPNAGLFLPLEALEPILEAISQYKGNALHSTTESKVLREWLTVEQERVSDMWFTLRTIAEQVTAPPSPPSTDSGISNPAATVNSTEPQEGRDA